MPAKSAQPPPGSDPQALERFRTARRAMREAALSAAEALVRLEACRAWRAEGCASLGELGERNGATAAEVRELLRVGQAILHKPELRADILEGRLSLGAVAALRDVVLDPTLQMPGEDLLSMAREVSTRQIARLVSRRVAERREGGPVAEVTIHLSGKGRDDLERARTVASRKAQHLLTYGETVETALRDYLRHEDARERKPGRRRLPPTGTLPGRAVPAEVDRALDDRFAGRCAMPKCDHVVWVDRAHLRPKAKGGDQELTNLILLCARHHGMLDRGEISIVGPPGARRFVRRGGEDLGPLDPSPGSRGPPS